MIVLEGQQLPGPHPASGWGASLSTAAPSLGKFLENKIAISSLPASFPPLPTRKLLSFSSHSSRSPLLFPYLEEFGTCSLEGHEGVKMGLPLTVRNPGWEMTLRTLWVG